MVKDIQIADFDYPLPDERIALHPLPKRDACRLIVASKEGPIRDGIFSDLPDAILAPGLMICNETKVINARIEFHKSTGARIEIFILDPTSPADYQVSFASRRNCTWACMIGNLKKWKEGRLTKEVMIPGLAAPLLLNARLLPLKDASSPAPTREVEFSWDNPDVTFATIVEHAGNIPIPPYLNRDSEESDLKDYQTVYSRVEGSVAAPTAGLHFTPELFSTLENRGMKIDKVTLHVGAGTFQPVKSDNIGDHPMHTETIHIPRSVIADIAEAIADERPITTVGTTSVRTIESLPYLAILARTADITDPEQMHVPQWMAYDPAYQNEDTHSLLRNLLKRMEEEGLDHLSASTAIMIAPGFKWRIVDSIITNFHQPQSTLLLLVASFLGDSYPRIENSMPRWRSIYNHALDAGYRFLSYGDACLFFRK